MNWGCLEPFCPAIKQVKLKLVLTTTFQEVPTRTEGIVKWQVFRNHLKRILEGPGIWSYNCKSWWFFLFVTSAACSGYSHVIPLSFCRTPNMFGFDLWRWKMTLRFQTLLIQQKNRTWPYHSIPAEIRRSGLSVDGIQPNSWDGECTGHWKLLTGWWFQGCLVFSPRKSGKWSNLTSIFFRWVFGIVWMSIGPIVYG